LIPGKSTSLKETFIHIGLNRILIKSFKYKNVKTNTKRNWSGEEEKVKNSAIKKSQCGRIYCRYLKAVFYIILSMYLMHGQVATRKSLSRNWSVDPRGGPTVGTKD
jgi:hypothetical protein